MDNTREIDWLIREKYAGRKTAAALRDIARLEKGEHISYVIGWTPFLGCRVDLSTHPLIPRPETEYWVEKAIQDIRKNEQMRKGKGARKNLHFLDLFCGSGCIGIAALKHLPSSKADFTDIEKKYFKGIGKSLRWNKIALSRARCITSDVFKSIHSGTQYDYIFANPPYIPTTGRMVAESVRRNEPRRALFGGTDGLRHIRRILREGKVYLKTNGKIFIEFDPPQKKAITKLGKIYDWNIEFYRDQYGRWRMAVLSTKTEKKQKSRHS